MKIFAIGGTEVGLSKINMDCDNKTIGLTAKCPLGSRQLDLGIVLWHWSITFYVKSLKRELGA